MSYAEVIVDIATEQVDRVFTYRIPEQLEGRLGPGYRVRVPFGRREKEGYVLRIKDTADYDENRIRDVIAPLEDYPALLPALIECAAEIKKETRCPMCEALRLMIPAGMRQGRVAVRREKIWRITFDPKDLDEKLRGEKRSLNRTLALTALSDGAWHSKSMAREPSIVQQTTLPGAGGASPCRNTLLGFSTDSRPWLVISKTPISSVAPKRFLIVRNRRYWWFRSPSKYTTVSTMCSRMRGPAI